MIEDAEFMNVLRRAYLEESNGLGEHEPDLLVMAPDVHEQFVRIWWERIADDTPPRPPRPAKFQFLNCLVLKSESLSAGKFVYASESKERAMK